MSALKETHMMPFNDIRSLIQNMPEFDMTHAQKHDARSLELLDNPSDLGILNLLSRHISVLQNRYPPMILKPEVAIFVSNQGVENALNPVCPSVVAKNVADLKSGKHIVNQACNIAGCALKTYDLNSAIPTEDIRYEAAMTEVEATQIMAYSMEAVRDTDLLIISELGCYQKIAAQSITKALFHDVLSDEYPFPDAVNKAVLFHGTDHEPLELLRRLGSREIAAMIGVIIAGRYQNIPIILDGLSALSAAAIIFKISPSAIDHCLLGHAFEDDLHSFLINQLEIEPISFLSLAYDAGVGSTIAVNIIKTALSIHNYTNK
jgi:nicotinate-nucleotide--dimethylbenzimidazole phosphoribosyltransferase